MERLVGDAHGAARRASTTVAPVARAREPRLALQHFDVCACDARSAAAGAAGGAAATSWRRPPAEAAAAAVGRGARRGAGSAGEGAAPLPHELNERRDGVARDEEEAARERAARRPELGPHAQLAVGRRGRCRDDTAERRALAPVCAGVHTFAGTRARAAMARAAMAREGRRRTHAGAAAYRGASRAGGRRRRRPARAVAASP